MMDYKKFLKKTSIVLSAVLLALQIGMQSASAFTVAQSATNTNGINVNVKQIKEIANVDFSVSNSTPSQSLAQTVTTLVSHDSVGPNGNLSISANASTVLKYLYPNYTDAQLQGATITPDQAVQWLHSVGYTANIINRPLNTTEIKSYLDKSEPIVTVLANQNPSDWITQSYSGVLYAHDDVDAGTQHLHESFIKSTYFGEATIQDGAEAQSFTFPSQTNSTDPIERADSYKWVSTIVDIKQDPSWTNSHSIMASKATGVFASKLSTSGTQSELDFTDPTITALYNKYPQTNTDPTTKLAAVSLINLYEDATHQKTVTDLNNYLKVTAASYVTPAQIESWYQYLGFDFDVLNGKAPMATTKAINNSGRLYITFYNASLATNPIKNIAMIGAGYTHNSFGGYMPRLTPVKAWQQIQTSYAYYGSTAADFQKDLADMQVYKYAKIQLGLGQYAETNGGIYTENSTIYNIRVKGTPDSAEVTTAPAPTSVKTVIPVSNVKPVTNASYIASPNFLIRETQGQQPWCSEFVNAAAINDVLKATAAASTITAQSIIQSIYPTTAPATLPTLSGGTIQNALKVIQAKYGVTADVLERPLTFVEVKSQIDAGNIVQMDGNDSATTTAAGTPDNPG
ncbi:MAG: hypothetical protein LBI13_03710, partial [Streptococcaceae bacterium]|nr:hypothetical protein [Streptococcaceae bacterium]